MDSNFEHSQNINDGDTDRSQDAEPNAVYVQEIELLKRRLYRSEKAKEEAESLLESKGRRLIKMDSQLRQKEDDLIRKIDQTTQYLVNAQRLANVATFHIDEDICFTGSNNLSKIVGAKDTINDLNQLRSMVHPRDKNDIEAIMSNALQGGLVDSAVEHDVRVQDEDGNMRWLRWSAEQKISADDEKMICYGAVRDITLERRSERHAKTLLALSERRSRQLQKMSAQLSERVKAMEMLSNALRDAREVAIRANKSKSRFLAMMSHDIRTPMNAILATLELLGLSNLDKNQKRQLELAQNSGDQLLFLLADIIEYARSDGWLLDIELKPTALTPFIQNFCDTWQQLANQKGLTISTKLDYNGPQYMSIDSTRIRQLLDNLISNAIKYTENGTIIIAAAIVEIETQMLLKLSVIDTGNGISPEAQKLLFMDLERGEHQDDDDIQGSGLGLSICRRIVNAMNGEIGLESQVDKGSIFWCKIPVKTISEAEYNASLQSQKPFQQLTVNGHRPKLLVAEDVAANRMVMTSMLEELGCDYDIAMDGRQAVEIVQIRDFDAILMDISMPHLNGMEATKIIRSQTNGNIPILAVTAFAADDEKEAIIASGMNGLVSKPLSLSSLYQALHAVFEHESDADLNLFIKNGALSNVDKALIPDFDVIDYIDIGKLRHQILSVPYDKRGQLKAAIIDDLRSWFRRFQNAWQASDEKEISTSFHALTGICNGFGAGKLLSSIEVLRKENGSRNSKILSRTLEIYEHTLSAFENVDDILERRKNK